MPACPRSELVDPSVVGVYHCWNRCVRGSYLCGVDHQRGTDYEHRRQWIHQLEQQLAALFAIEIGFHATLGNHLHLVLRNRPDVAARWSDHEVVRRWLTITKLKRTGSDELVEPSEERIKMELAKPGQAEKLRARLAHVSWFMGTLCENISRRANAEDGAEGAFWESRFSCRNLIDEASLLVCGIYVDLNAIRAGLASTPEESRYTSVYDRLQARRHTPEGEGEEAMPPDGWLCPLTLNERNSLNDCDQVRSSTPWRASDKGLLPLTLEKYLELLDWTGRQVRSTKRGVIPAYLAPILERLKIQPDQWADAVMHFDSWFGRVLGNFHEITELAQRTGQRWFHGQRRCAQVFA